VLIRVDLHLLGCYTHVPSPSCLSRKLPARGFQEDEAPAPYRWVGVFVLIQLFLDGATPKVFLLAPIFAPPRDGARVRPTYPPSVCQVLEVARIRHLKKNPFHPQREGAVVGGMGSWGASHSLAGPLRPVVVRHERRSMQVSFPAGLDDKPTTGQHGFGDKMKTRLRQLSLDFPHARNAEIRVSQRTPKRPAQT